MVRDFFRNLISEIEGTFQTGEEMPVTLSDGKDKLVIYAEKEHGTTDIVVEYWPCDGEFEGAGYPLTNTTTRKIADSIYDGYGVERFEKVKN